MSHTGTGFWVFVALMLVMSVVAIAEAAIAAVSARLGRARTASPRAR